MAGILQIQTGEYRFNKRNMHRNNALKVSWSESPMINIQFGYFSLSSVLGLKQHGIFQPWKIVNK